MVYIHIYLVTGRIVYKKKRRRGFVFYSFKRLVIKKERERQDG